MIVAVKKYITVEKDDGRYIYGRDEKGHYIRSEKASINDQDVLESPTETHKVDRKKIVKLLTEAGHRPFKVTFYKKPTIRRTTELLDAADISTRKARREISKKILEGEKRVLTGHLYQVGDQPYGRSLVVDLEAGPGTNLRLVDHRSITALEIGNKRYVV